LRMSCEVSVPSKAVRKVAGNYQMHEKRTDLSSAQKPIDNKEQNVVFEYL
jgi:hypothetical protein